VTLSATDANLKSVNVEIPDTVSAEPTTLPTVISGVPERPVAFPVRLPVTLPAKFPENPLVAVTTPVAFKLVAPIVPTLIFGVPVSPCAVVAVPVSVPTTVAPFGNVGAPVPASFLILLTFRHFELYFSVIYSVTTVPPKS